jgi:hypothetical protein
MLLRHARTSSRSPIRQFHARRGVACLAAHAVAADQAARGHAARAAARPLGPSSSRSNLRCLSGPPCCCSARGRTGPPPRERSSRSRSRRTGTRERHGATGAFALISRAVTPLFLGFRCELAAPLQCCFITPICLCDWGEEVLLIWMRSRGVIWVLPRAMNDALSRRFAER